MSESPIQTVCNLVEQAYLIAFECQEMKLMLHLGLAMQVSIAKAVSERIEEIDRKENALGPDEEVYGTGISRWAAVSRLPLT
jgi:hypothetical protein